MKCIFKNVIECIFKNLFSNLNLTNKKNVYFLSISDHFQAIKFFEPLSSRRGGGITHTLVVRPQKTTFCYECLPLGDMLFFFFYSGYEFRISPLLYTTFDVLRVMEAR